jgi:hypothetical protein
VGIDSKTQGREDVSGKKEDEHSCSVKLFDTVNLPMTGEYFIRGQLTKQIINASGIFEPIRRSETEDSYAAATGMVNIEERGLIPIRILTFKDNVRIKKGTTIGTFTRCLSEQQVTRVNRVTCDKESRWNILEKKIIPHLEHLRENTPERIQLIQLLEEFSDIFSISRDDIGVTNVVTHAIDTEDITPIRCGQRRIPIALEEKVEEMIQELANKEIIRPSDSPWNAPLVIIPKKNGDVRITVDYRKLNSVTKRPVFPIPDTQHLLDTLSGSAYFTTLDFSSGYYNVPMKADDIEKTAFSTKQNHWEFVRMPMGLSTAPFTFQKLMHKIFSKENWQTCLIYLDDICIFSRSLDEQIVRLRTIFDRIRNAGMKLSPDKCSFLKQEVSYLGYKITKEGTMTDPSKIEKISNWATPKTVEDLRSWLGLCGYYRKFIKNYAKIVCPLEEKCKDTWTSKRKKTSTQLEWNDECQSAFQTLKEALTSAPILTYPTANDQFILDCDASHDCVGAVLSQKQNGIERVIAYASKKLTSTQRQYCITRKELFAVYHFVHYFKHYLLGRRFICRTDHRALSWMLNWKTPNTSQYCKWKQELEVFDMIVLYRRGEEHANADALSRWPNCQQCELNHPFPKQKRNVKVFNDGVAVQRFFCRQINTLHEEIDQTADSNLRTIIELMKMGQIEEKEPESLKCCSEEAFILWKKRNNLRFRGGLLYIYCSRSNEYKLIIPKDQRTQLIKLVHETFAHVGTRKTLCALKDDHYWPNMDFDVRLWVNACHYCNERKVHRNGKKNEKKAGLESNYPFQKISLDVTGPLPRGPLGEQYILGIIDNFSRFVTLVPLKRVTAETVGKALFEKWVTLFGIPEVIHSDRGTEFENRLMFHLCQLLGIRKSRSSPYYPQGNAIIERLFGTVKDLLSTTMRSRKQSWVSILPSVEFALRCTIHKSTNFSPYEIIFGRKMKTPFSNESYRKSLPRGSVTKCDFVKEVQNNIDLVQKKILDNRELKLEKKTEKNMFYPIGTKVMVKILPQMRGIGKPRYAGPYKIVSKKGDWSYVLEDEHGKKIERNVHHLKPLKLNTTSKCSAKVGTSIETISGEGKKGGKVKSSNSPAQIQAREPNRTSVPVGVGASAQMPRYPKRTHAQPLRYGY